MTLFASEVMQDNEDWTFRDAETRYFTHCFHDYPARMIPQIADRLIREYCADAKLLLDPYCGTGTTLVEGVLHGIESIGTDINPLARLIAKAKTTKLDADELDGYIKLYMEFIFSSGDKKQELPPWMNAERVAFWFKPEITRKLRNIYSFLSHIKDAAIANFFLVAFSETIRESSNTKSGEFKLVRRSGDKFDRHNPDPYEIMLGKLGRNRSGYLEMLAFMGKGRWARARVCDFNTVDGIPLKEIKDASVDIVVTSPPYGDSHTTVAYGQYSRLSSDWLGFEEGPQVDRNLMGGRSVKSLARFGIPSLDAALNAIHEASETRAREACSFYVDLRESIRNVGRTVRPGGYACYVVANRRVRGVTLPTDDSVQGFFRQSGFEHVTTHLRSIPNKRMPAKNSPSNVPGETDTTMHTESIVVMRRC